MTTQINKERSVKTMDRVAVELGEDADWLFEVAIEMEPEDGVSRPRRSAGSSGLAFAG